MNDMVISAIELFSGVGMLGEGVRAGLAHMGIAHRTLCYVEREAYPAAVLAARMEEGSISPAPIWSDVTTFNARAWRGKVDCVVAGFPCQDMSVAGKRAGLEGKRSGLFYEVMRVADESGASSLLLENVQGLYSADGYGARCVCGWDYRWGGIDQHTKTWRSPRGCGDGRESDPTTELAVSNIRRYCSSNGQGNGKMASQVLLDTDDRSGDLLPSQDEAIHADQEGYCGSYLGSRLGGSERTQRTASSLDEGEIFGIRESQGNDHESEQEGATRRPWKLDCPACGEPLGSEASELANGAFRDIQWELAARGFNAEWMCLRAADVGASHGRARWFCFAWRNVADAEGQRGRIGQRDEQPRRAEAESAGECMVDAARHERDGSHGESGSGRGICETGDQLGNTEHAGRNAAQNRESRAAGNDGNAPGSIANGELAGSSDSQLADSSSIGRQEGSRITGAEGAMGQVRECELGTGDRCGSLADTSSAGLQRPRFGTEHGSKGWSEPHGSISERCGLFAPGPSDPRWGAILDQFPEVAPALIADFRSVVNGLAFDMGDSRAQRLKCVGNGCVPLQVAAAFVLLARRAGIFG